MDTKRFPQIIKTVNSKPGDNEVRLYSLCTVCHKVWLSPKGTHIKSTKKYYFGKVFMTSCHEKWLETRWRGRQSKWTSCRLLQSFCRIPNSLPWTANSLWKNISKKWQYFTKPYLAKPYLNIKHPRCGFESRLIQNTRWKWLMSKPCQDWFLHPILVQSWKRQRIIRKI